MKRFLFALITLVFLYSCSNKENSLDLDKQETDSISLNSADYSEDKTGMKAPDFSYEDIHGNQISLSDFRGKLVYMDIWATWCGPCKMQIPALKKLEEKYKNQNIVVLSISIDPEKDKEKWKNYVINEQLKGIQLYAGAESDFPIDYQVEFIPRFVLISPNGDIMMDQAPEPLNLTTGEINPYVEQIFDIYIKTNKKATS